MNIFEEKKSLKTIGKYYIIKISKLKHIFDKIINIKLNLFKIDKNKIYVKLYKIIFAPFSKNFFLKKKIFIHSYYFLPK